MTGLLVEAGALDPSEADTTELLFKLPSGETVAVPATITTNGSPATAWYLEVIVTGAGDTEGFHDLPGKVSIQGHIVWSAGNEFHTQIITIDSDGNELRVFKNLEVTA